MNERPAEPDAEQVWQEHADRLLRQLRTKLAGLDGDEVRSRLEAYGPNDAANGKRTPLWLQFLARFGNPLIILLLIAGGRYCQLRHYSLQRDARPECGRGPAPAGGSAGS